MGPGTRWTGALLVTAALLAVPLAAVSAQSPRASETGDVLGRFTAHLRGSQMDHASTLLNVSYSPPGGSCKPGMQSYSTDQEMVFESAPVEVEAVRLPPDAVGWGGQSYVLVAQGTDAGTLSDLVTYSAPTGEMDVAPVLFELPLDVKVTRSNADPATGEGPAEPQPFTVACTGGDGVARSVPPSDCGERTITSSMAITQPRCPAQAPTERRPRSRTRTARARSTKSREDSRGGTGPLPRTRAARSPRSNSCSTPVSPRSTSSAR